MMLPLDLILIFKSTRLFMQNPWTTLSNRKVYDNPWIQVQHREVITPKGTDGIYGLVHFKNWAIGIVPLDHELNTWLVGQYRYAIDQYSWELPEGGCPIGTSPLETAKRELKEEAGIIANEWIEIMSFHTSNSVTNEYGKSFVARDLIIGNPDPEDTEEIVIKKLPFQEVYEMVMSGALTDSLTIMSILKVKLLLDQNLL